MVKVASADNWNVALVGWIALGTLALLMAAVMIGLFVEERGLEMPRMYEDDALR